MTNLPVAYEAPRELALPDKSYLERELKAVREFQQLARQLLNKGHDYGVIPGTGDKETLLKPGAEKITKLLGLADTYEVMDKVEDWDRPFFRYLIRCRLISVASGNVVAESFGECNSYENRYRWRWVFKSRLPQGETGAGLVTRTIKARGQDTKQYRLENEDPFSLINTLIKMAQKRALVGAALSAGRLSDIFTQDMEDLVLEGEAEEIQEEAPRAAPSRPARPTQQQIDRVWADARALGWDQAALQEVLKAKYGISSSRDMTADQVSDLIQFIEAEKERGKPADPQAAMI